MLSTHVSELSGAPEHPWLMSKIRRDIEQGDALALGEILTQVHSDLHGEIVGVSFERKRKRWIYEFKIIDPAAVPSGGSLTRIFLIEDVSRIARKAAAVLSDAGDIVVNRRHCPSHPCAG